MKFSDYLKEKVPLICAYLSVMILIFIILLAFNLYYTGIILVIFLMVVLGLILLFCKFYQKKLFYDELYIIISSLDNKLLIHETTKANFLEGNILLDILRITNKYKIEEVNKYKFLQEEFEEFMELWVHEIKTPLSAINLICENNKNNITGSISEEAIKIDGLIEMILFYARSQMVEKDYLIKKTRLSEIVNKVIVKNKNSFLEKKIKLDMHDLDILVKTDSKWMEFIINQIIVNSIKYTSDNPCIEIYGIINKENACLVIKDNGIGISPKDLPRVFDKGFTGENGRSKYNSTGMGLYLVKKLCLALGNDVLIDSTLGKGTILKIIFPLGSFTDNMIGDGDYGIKS